MSGKSPLAASAEQRDGLRRLAVSANRAEADRARAILLSLSGWKSAAIGEVFGVREDTVRDWRSTFMREGLAGIERHPAHGCPPVKAQAALARPPALAASSAEGAGRIAPRLRRPAGLSACGGAACRRNPFFTQHHREPRMRNAMPGAPLDFLR